MDFVCPTCGESFPRDLMVIIPHTEEHIIKVIAAKHPDWVGSDGICSKCLEYFKSQMSMDR